MEVPLKSHHADIFKRWSSGGTVNGNHSACSVAVVPRIQRCALLHCVSDVFVCVCARAQRCHLCKGDSFLTQPHPLWPTSWCPVLVHVCAGVAVLLAQGLQRVQSTLDITDLCGQCVYGLHGAIQLLAAGHQSVHTLWEPKHKARNKKDEAKWSECNNGKTRL